MTTVDLYCRVSSVEQAEEGYSLEEQEARLRAYADSQGWVVHACHVDPGFSGAKLERPGIQKVIADAENHLIQKVITYKLDRLSRSQKDTLYLIEDVFLKNGVDYISMTESFNTSSAFGKAILGILSVFAQLERENIAERMMMGRVASAKEGNWRGGSGVPVGYRYIPKTATEDGKLVVDPYEAQIVRTVFDMFLAGNTYNAIYEHCRKLYTTSYGQFASGGAARIPIMLSNRAYIGDIKYQGIWYKGKHESIISEETFYRAQDLMVDYQKTLDEHRRNPYKRGHLLTGFLFCGECGSRWCYHSGRYTTKAGEVRRYGTYQCYTKNSQKAMAKADSCSIPVWSDSELEGIIWDQILSLRFEDLQADTTPDTIELTALQDKLSKIEKQLSKLIDLYMVGSLPIEQIQSRSADLQAQKDKLIAQCDVVRRRSGKTDPEMFKSALERVTEVMESGTLDEQRDILRILVKKITLLPNRRIQIDWNI